MRQGNDHGSQYRSAIYPLSTTQMEAALSSKDDYQKVGSLPAPGFRMPSAPAVSPARSAPPARRESGSFHPALCSICTFFGNVCQPLGIEPLCFINVLISEILKTDLYAFLFKINLSRWICSLAYSLSPSLCLSPAVSLHHSLFLSSLCINLLRFITKYHRLDGSNNWNVFLTVLEAGSLLLGAVRRGSAPGLSPWLVDGPPLPLCLHIIFPLCMSISVSKFPLFRTTVVIQD